MRRSRAGFTVVEMLVVVGIIGILTSMILTGVMAAKRAAARNRTKVAIATLSTAITRYEHDTGNYPPGDGKVSGAQDLYQALTTPGKNGSYVDGLDLPSGDPQGTGRKAFLDSWANPIRYTHHKYYSGAPRADEYRLESAGPDGEFGTNDDITNYEK